MSIVFIFSYMSSTELMQDELRSEIRSCGGVLSYAWPRCVELPETEVASCE